MRDLKDTVAGATLLALLLFAGACDADSDSADSTMRSTDVIADSVVTPGPVSANEGCALLSEGDLEQVVGFDVVMNDNSTGNCIATPASGDPVAPTIDFRVEPRENAFDYFSAQADADPIQQLGEHAVWATLNETTGYVVAVTGGSSVVVGIGKADGVTTESRRQAEAIARLLVAKHP